MKRIVIILIMLLNSPTTLAGFSEHSMVINDTTRWYRIYIPQTLKPNPTAVLLLHGGTQSMRKIFRSRAGGTQAWLTIAEREGILLVVPNGVNPNTGDGKGNRQHWNDLREERIHTREDDVIFIKHLLQTLTKQYKIKKSFVTGASNGGMMTFRLLIEAPELFTAGAAFIANLPVNMQNYRQGTPKPIMIMNGTEDPLVPWDGGTVGRNRGEVISAEATARWWVNTNQAQSKAIISHPFNNIDTHCEITLYHYPAPNRNDVYFYAVKGGGHAMPSINHPIPNNLITRHLIGTACKETEGAEVAWKFFQSY